MIRQIALPVRRAVTIATVACTLVSCADDPLSVDLDVITPESAASATGAQALRAAALRDVWIFTGYNVYVRPEGAAFGPALAAGLPPLEADGTMSHVVTGFTSGVRYYFAVRSRTEQRIRAVLDDGQRARYDLDSRPTNRGPADSK